MESAINTSRRIVLNPTECYFNVADNIYAKLEREILGKCIEEGYVVSIDKVKLRSLGKIDSNTVNGDVIYDIIFSAKVINLKEGLLIENCVITTINKVGIFATKDTYLNIVVISDNLPNDYLTKFTIRQNIDIKIVSFKYNLNDSEIMILGVLADRITETQKKKKRATTTK